MAKPSTTPTPDWGRSSIAGAKAEMALLAAGGTRGEFARRWPSVFVEKVRRRVAGG